MSTFIPIASVSPDIIKVIPIFAFFAIILAGPLIYRILSGEKFGWFRDPRFKRLDDDQWQQLRDKADRVIEGNLEIDADELCDLLSEMQCELVQSRRRRDSIEFGDDCKRTEILSQKLQEMDLRIEPFDSLTEYLKRDGLIEQSRKLHKMVHDPDNKNSTQLKKDFLDELVKIRSESWNILNQDTRAAWKKSVKALKYNPFRSIYIYAAILAIGLGLRFYFSIVEDKGYRFYNKHPVWIVFFAVIIGLPVLILTVKFLIWKYSTRENPHQST